MAFIESVGKIFYGISVNCYGPCKVYAYQIVGSSAKYPICRAIRILRNTTHNGPPHGGGSADARIDPQWFEENPPLPKPLKKSGWEGTVIRVRYTDYGAPQLIVVGQYATDRILLDLMTHDEALAQRSHNTFCSN